MSFRLSLLALLVLVSLSSAALARDSVPGLVWIEGGTFLHPRSNYAQRGITVSGFYLAPREVTQREWTAVMGANPSFFKGEELPVESVSWYECIEYCNRRSVAEGLTPYYEINRQTRDPHNDCTVDDLKWTVTLRKEANGYRLPTEAEWEYAAQGGALSRHHAYSGSDDLATVGWFWQNSGDEPIGGLWNWPAIEKNHGRSQPVGQKQPNELGLYDLSGNVREWCWDWFGELPRFRLDPRGTLRGDGRVWKGGSWMAADFCAEPSFRAHFEPTGRGKDHGLRVCRSR